MLSILKSAQIQLPRNIIIITLNAHIFRCLFVCTPTNTEREKGSESGRKRDVSLETDFFPLKCLWDPAGMFSLLCSGHSLIFFLLLIRDANFPLETHFFHSFSILSMLTTILPILSSWCIHITQPVLQLLSVWEEGDGLKMEVVLCCL